MPYDPDKCFGYVFLLGEDQKNLVKCCVKMTFKSKLPADHLWQTSVKAFNLGIDDVFAMSKWIAVLVMTWNLQESPFSGVRLARNEGMDPCSSPYMTHYSSFRFLFHSFMSTLNP